MPAVDFEPVRLPGLRQRARQGRGHIGVIQRGDHQRRAGRWRDLHACGRVTQHGAGFITPVAKRSQRAGRIRVRHGSARAWQARQSPPWHHLGPLAGRQLPMQRRRRQGIDQDEGIGRRGCFRGEQSTQAGTYHGARSRQAGQVCTNLPGVVFPARRPQSGRLRLQIRRVHGDPVRAPDCAPAPPFPAATTSTMQEQRRRFFRQAAWLPARPAPTTRAK